MPSYFLKEQNLSIIFKPTTESLIMTRRKILMESHDIVHNEIWDTILSATADGDTSSAMHDSAIALKAYQSILESEGLDNIPTSFSVQQIQLVLRIHKIIKSNPHVQVDKILHIIKMSIQLTEMSIAKENIFDSDHLDRCCLEFDMTQLCNPTTNQCQE